MLTVCRTSQNPKFNGMKKIAEKKMSAAYIEHVQRVCAETERRFGDDSLEAIVARFHDSLEDNEFSVDELTEAIRKSLAFPPTVALLDVLMEAVVCITRRSEETYAEYIQRVKRNPLARRVKIVDLETNLFGSPTLPPGSLTERYVKALHTLKNLL